MTEKIEAFAVTECETDDGGTCYEVEVLIGKHTGETAYVDCMECARTLMRLVLMAEGLDPDEVLHSERETVH